MRYLFLILYLCSYSVYAEDTLWDLDSVIQTVQNSSGVNLVASNGFRQTLSKNYVLQLDEVRRKISLQSSIYPKFIISSSQEINAGALWQNGQPVTVFNLGLLTKIGEDYDAIAAVVSHEYSHLTLRHQQSQQITNTVVDILAGFALIAIDSKYGGSNRNPYHGLHQAGLGLTATLAKTSYSRTEELEADAQGVKYMIASGYSPEGAIRLQETIIPSNSTFFSTHPSSESRIQNIKLAMNNIPSYSSNGIENNKTIIAKNTQTNTHSFIGKANSNTYLKTCEDIGFKPNTNQFGDCVFKLSGEKIQINENATKIGLVENSRAADAYANSCIDIGFKVETKKFEDCINRLKNNSKSAALHSEENLSGVFPVKGQIGSVISIKEGYIIFSSSIQGNIPEGTKIKIASGGDYINGTIANYYDGYYSANVDNVIPIKQGSRVIISH